MIIVKGVSPTGDSIDAIHHRSGGNGRIDTLVNPGYRTTDAPVDVLADFFIHTGIRFDFMKSLTGYLEIAKPLTRPSIDDGDDARVYARLEYHF